MTVFHNVRSLVAVAMLAIVVASGGCGAEDRNDADGETPDDLPEPGQGCTSDAPCDSGVSSPPVTADWWVAPDGNDLNPGTEAAPFKTVTKAWSVVESGQTIMVRGGDYLIDDTMTLSGKSGADANHMIKLFAYPGEVPKFHPTSTTSFSTAADRGISLSGRYLHIKGLEIYGFSQRLANCNKIPAGLHAQNLNDSVLEQLDVHHNGFGLAISTRSGVHSTGNVVLNSDFHHNSDPWSNAYRHPELGSPSQCRMADCPSCEPYGGSDGLTIRVSSASTTNRVQGCRMWMNSDDGVDLWSTTGTVVIENSWAFWNGFRPGATPTSEDRFIEGGDGNGYKLGATSTFTTTVKRRIAGSLAFENKMWGFNDNNAQCNAEIYNNTSYNNCYFDLEGFCGGYNFSFSPGIAYNLINNISFGDAYNGSTHAASLGSGSDQTKIHHNSWQVGGVDSSDFDLSSAGVDGPRQGDGSLPALEFLHLQAGSNLIDAGTTISGFPANCSGSCDLGAYEY